MSVSTTSAPTALKIVELSKRFGPTVALDDVSIDIASGSVHALIGGNGSGKSTLIKVLAGVHEADSGHIEVKGLRHDAGAMDPAVARALGFRFVHQQPSTFRNLSVMENLAIGSRFATAATGRIRWRTERRAAQAVLERFEIDADPMDELGTLNPASQTMVAIARALKDRDEANTGLLVLDEPTASLPLVEVDLLLAAIKRYAAAGQTILYVSHRLHEITEVADQVTVLRDGKLVTTVPGAGSTHDQLAGLLTGRGSAELRPSRTKREGPGEVALQVEGLRAGAVRDVSLELRSGEVLGIAGLLGSGRSALLRALFGLVPHEAGAVTLDGKPLDLRSPRDAMRAGFAFVPEDRSALAAFSQLNILENLGIAHTREFFHAGRLRHSAEAREAAKLCRDYKIKIGSLRDGIETLSGGNAQKVILARWLRGSPRIVLLDEPTQGVDVGARFDIWAIVRHAVAGGAAVIVVSSDFDELADVSDRVLTLHRGTVTGVLEGDDVTEENIDRAALLGGHHD